MDIKKIIASPNSSTFYSDEMIITSDFADVGSDIVDDFCFDDNDMFEECEYYDCLRDDVE